MTKSEYLELHRGMCEKMMEITRKKNHDYAGGDSTVDPFQNFRAVERLGICTVEQGFMTRMSDKMARIATLSIHTEGKNLVEDEKVEDTLLDLANYSILMLGYLKSKESK